MVRKRLSMEEVVQLARDLAMRAHAGQIDKAGNAYFTHVERVALSVNNHPLAMAVAYLHDVREDCPSFWAELDTFPDEVVWRVDLLTRTARGASEEYYRRIAGDAVALRVKLADIADNSDESRLAQLSVSTAERLRAKYAKARAMLLTFAAGS